MRDKVSENSGGLGLKVHVNALQSNMHTLANRKVI